LLAAAALVAYLIKPGDTLSGIASSHSVKVAAVQAANPQIKNPNLIYAGQIIKLPKGSPAAHRSHTPSVHTSAHRHSAPSHRSSSHKSSSHTTRAVTRSTSHGSSGYSSSDLADVPGVPRSYAACVAYRESTDLKNPAARGNAYGIIPASGYDGYHMTLSQQKQVFAKLYREYGKRPWRSDGC
jgi:LysM repeat protein